MAEEYDIIRFEMADSTNTRLEAVRDLLPSGTIFSASFQSCGKGQKGNRWFGGADENLTFSLLFKAGLPASGQFAVSMAASLAIVRYLEVKGICAKIKWPNDIYAGDRKICGMLISHSVRSGTLSSSVIGIGLNVNQTVFDPSLPNPASLSSVLGGKFDLDTELHNLARCLTGRLNSAAGCATLGNDYNALLYHKDEWHRYLDCRDAAGASLVPTTQTDVGGRVFEGKIIGVTEHGLLTVEERYETVNQFAFKEIRYL